MSPELFEPERFGLRDSRRTKSSDCYALGMLTYEVLSGSIPFARYSKYVTISRVLRGERPERPQGVEGNCFTDEVWSITERCWKHQPSDRPSIDCVLQCLEEASRLWTPFSSLMTEGPQVEDSLVGTVSDLSTEGSWAMV